MADSDCNEILFPGGADSSLWWIAHALHGVTPTESDIPLPVQTEIRKLCHDALEAKLWTVLKPGYRTKLDMVQILSRCANGIIREDTGRCALEMVFVRKKEWDEYRAAIPEKEPAEISKDGSRKKKPNQHTREVEAALSEALANIKRLALEHDPAFRMDQMPGTKDDFRVVLIRWNHKLNHLPEDKKRLAERLAEYGVSFLPGSRPGRNVEFYERISPQKAPA